MGIIMNKKFLSVFTAMAMSVCTFAGCSDSKSSDNSQDSIMKEAISYETVESDGFRFNVRSDFEETEDSSLTYSYGNDTEFSIYFQNVAYRTSRDVYIDFCNDYSKYSENYSQEVIDCGDYEVVIFTYIDSDNIQNTLFAAYKKGDRLSGFSVWAEYPVKKDEELVRTLALEIIESAEFIGDVQETRQTEFECDYFSVKLPDYLYFRHANNNEVKIGYYEIFNKATLESYLTVEAMPDSEYKSAEEYVKAEWDAELEEIKEVEILGYDGYCIEDSIRNLTKYAFDKDGVIYSILIYADNEDGSDSAYYMLEFLVEDDLVIK